MQITFNALPSQIVDDIRRTERDAYGNPVERHTATAPVYPCRHCLGEIAPGRDYLILAHRPFQARHAYAETGPIFLCADPCKRADPSPDLPPILRADQFLLRAYDADERIIYGTGKVVPKGAIIDRATQLFQESDVAFIDIRSAANNCFQCRLMRD